MAAVAALFFSWTLAMPEEFPKIPLVRQTPTR